MIKVQVSPRKVVFVKGERDKQGLFCSFFADNSEDFPLGNKFVNLPKDCSVNAANLAMVKAARDYFA